MIKPRKKKKLPPIEFIPILLLFLLFYFIPLMTSWTYLTKGSTDILSSLRSMLHYLCQTAQNQYFILGLRNLLEMAAIQTGLVMIIALIIAICLWKSAHPQVFIKLLIIPSFIPSAGIALLWKGFQNDIESILIIHLSQNLEGLISKVMLILLFIWERCGLSALVIFGAIKQQPKSCFEAARIDGANEWQLCRRMIIPMISPVLCGTSVYILSLSFRVYRESWLIYGNYPNTSVYTLMNYMRNKFEKLNYSEVASSSVLLMLNLCIIAVAGLIIWRFWGKYEKKI